MNQWEALLESIREDDVLESTVRIKAIDVIPHHWAVWCTVGDRPKPFSNEICSRRWSEDGEYIWFLLDTHNFLKAAPDEELELVPVRHAHRSEKFLADIIERDRKVMEQRPERKS